MAILLWLDVLVMLTAAALLVAGVGVAGLWLAVIALGIAVVVVVERHGRSAAHR